MLRPDAVAVVRTLDDLAGHEASDLVLLEGCSEPVMAYLAERLLPAQPATTTRASAGPRVR